jgi:hypothetical protein
MTINEDTQLVTCRRCGHVMSAFNALMIFSRHYEEMKYESEGWIKYKEEQAKKWKSDQVRRMRRERS